MGHKVLIGIQARSTSKRFPRKSFAMLGGKMLLQHVVDACNKAALYSNKYSAKHGLLVETAVLCPMGDDIAETFKGKVLIHEGPEDDVLSRYAQAAKKFSADYIVRVTGDCPLIPPFLITKHINAAIQNAHDYASNIDERFRTAVDGFDCEVISKRALEWLDTHASEKYDREHVTPLIRKKPPHWASIGHIVGYLDLSVHEKMSVDTPEDLERVRRHFEKIRDAQELAEKLFGRNSVHRF
jgi:spore coat polysaccharide biosynthesis protein SpsF (cytidylyltransferase family)